MCLKKKLFFFNPTVSADECGKVRCAFCSCAVHCHLCLEKNGCCKDKGCVEQQNKARDFLKQPLDFGKNHDSWASPSRLSPLFIPQDQHFTPEGHGVFVSNVECPPQRKNIIDCLIRSSVDLDGPSANQSERPAFDESPPKSGGNAALLLENGLSPSQSVSSVKKRKRDRLSNCGFTSDAPSLDHFSDDDEKKKKVDTSRSSVNSDGSSANEPDRPALNESPPKSGGNAALLLETVCPRVNWLAL